MSTPDARTFPQVTQAVIRWDCRRSGAPNPAEPLLVSGRPFLEILIDDIARQGVRHFLLLDATDGTRARAIVEKLPEVLGIDVAIEVVSGVATLDGLGALWQVRDRLADPFYLVDGDAWSEVPLAELVRSATEDPEVFGVLAIRRFAEGLHHDDVPVADGPITALDGASLERADARLATAGLALLRRTIFDAASSPDSLDRASLAALAARGDLVTLVSDAYVLDLSRPLDRERAAIEIPSRRRRPALFLDRDGVINSDHGYVGSVDRFEWIDGAREAIRRANRLGYYVFVVTNQSGIARGYFTEKDYRAVKDHIRNGLAEIGAHIDDERHCPFHEEGVVEAYRRASDHRKPGPGMLLELIRRWPVDVARSLMVGDSDSDLVAASAAGIEGHLFSGGNLDEFIEPLLQEVVR